MYSQSWYPWHFDDWFIFWKYFRKWKEIRNWNVRSSNGWGTIVEKHLPRLGIFINCAFRSSHKISFIHSTRPNCLSKGSFKNYVDGKTWAGGKYLLLQCKRHLSFFLIRLSLRSWQLVRKVQKPVYIHWKCKIVSFLVFSHASVSAVFWR